MVLGWITNTRKLLLCLPLEKYEQWIREITEILNNPVISRKVPESIIEKLVHVSYIIPISRHFLYCLQLKLAWIRTNSIERPVCLHHEEIEDLELWMSLLHQTHVGISLNGLVLRTPTRIGFSESCPQGLGVYTHGGRGWRLKTNPKLAAYGEDVSNNLLEFLGMAITTWLYLLECDKLGLVDELILVLEDNTSAILRIFKSCRPLDSIYRKAVIFIARKLGNLVLRSKIFIASQHLPRIPNLTADWLSFEGTSRLENGASKQNPIAFDCPPNDVVTHRILSSFPQLFPVGFRVCHLPTKINSFLSLMVKQKEE